MSSRLTAWGREPRYVGGEKGTSCLTFLDWPSNKSCASLGNMNHLREFKSLSKTAYWSADGCRLAICNIHHIMNVDSWKLNQISSFISSFSSVRITYLYSLLSTALWVNKWHNLPFLLYWRCSSPFLNTRWNRRGMGWRWMFSVR